ncbi:hypothetical protein ABIE44_000393 [Marmoricola sp. OAE513]|uniref:hypothetical protein n=1 Tax=Marmoricola sp. OAE513 TaxID=2817894 RepID=UPI001AE40F9C
MNTVVIAPEVLAFVASVRAQLADLEPEELLEITDGLEADLTDLVAEQGTGALGDPVAYAAELRQAAGLAPQVRRPRGRVALLALLDRGFAEVTSRKDAALAGLPGDASGLLASLQPIWWAVRGYVAVQSALLWSGGWALTPVPDDSIDGGLITLAVMLVSVQLGRKRLPVLRDWAGNALFRIAVIALNVVAAVMIPVVANGFEHRDAQTFESGYSRGINESGASYVSDESGAQAGLYADGRWVSNIFPYDAAGHPLVGVQLYDQSGKAIETLAANECVYDADQMPIDSTRVFYPWSDGAAQKKNVFPVPSRVEGPEVVDPDPMAFTGENRPSVSGFPFASVPKISLPGLLTSSAKTPAKAFVPGPRTGPINPIDYGC